MAQMKCPQTQIRHSLNAVYTVYIKSGNFCKNNIKIKHGYELGIVNFERIEGETLVILISSQFSVLSGELVYSEI